MKILNTTLTIIILLYLHVILIISIQQDLPINDNTAQYTHSWPHFYHLGETTHPTQTILDNLTHYQNEWRKLQQAENGFDTTYTYTFAWDCAPSKCDTCLQANKFINVDDDTITSLTTSELNSPTRIQACIESDNSNDINDIEQYMTIDQLYTMVIDFVQNGLNAPSESKNEYLIIELMLHQYYYFPMAVKLEQAETYIAWDIECFKPGHNENENDVCDYTYGSNETEKEWTFWITEEMQSFLGWSMIFLILVACSLGYCINWLKKKKSEKIEAWRAKEAERREAEERKEDEERRDRHNRKGKYKSKRKSSKAKHRAHLEKSKRERDKLKHKQYSNIPIDTSDQSDGNVSDDVKEEEEEINQ